MKAILFGGMAFAAFLTTAGDFTDFGRLAAGERAFLKVGLWAFPVACDFDGDGDLDLVVCCPGYPHHGIYLFENPTPKGERNAFPTFRKGVKISDAAYFNFVRANARPDAPVTIAGKAAWDFRTALMTNAVPFRGLKENVHVHSPRSNVWRLQDMNGDGRDDVLVGVGDWSGYGWNDRYDAKGNWTNEMVTGYVYLAKNVRGAGPEAEYGPAERLADETGKPLTTVGAPMPMAEDWAKRGMNDILCGSFVNGFTFFRNAGTRAEPRFAPGVPVIAADGKPLEMELCMITPSACDWDGDGDLDILCGDEDGRVAFIENTGRLAPEGYPVFNQPRYFLQEPDFAAFGALVTPCACDWDGDGDFDLVCGDSSGHLAVLENVSGKGVGDPEWKMPRFFTCRGRRIEIRAGANGSIQGPVEERWGYTVPSVADWDGDGFLDLVVNSIFGDVVWYRNPGCRGTTELEPARPVEVEWQGAQPALAWGWRKPQGKALLTQWRTTPCALDWTGDGLVDLVMLDQEGYLALFERFRDAAGVLRLKAPVRAFRWADGRPMRLATGWAGASGRRKICFSDWNGDGRPDLIVNGHNADLLVQVGAKDGAWHFENRGRLGARRLHNHTTAPTAADFDGDGRDEVVVGAEDGFFYLRAPEDAGSATEDLVRFVDPLIGTGTLRKDTGNAAAMIPAACVPFGGVKWAPMTRLTRIGQVCYADRDETFMGVVATRKPCPWMGDFGQFSFQARVNTSETALSKRAVRLDRGRSAFRPDYLKTVDADGVVMEVAPASHAAFLRVTFPDGAKERRVMIDASRRFDGVFDDRKPAHGRIDFFDTSHRCVMMWNRDRVDGRSGPVLKNWCAFARLDLSVPYEACGGGEEGDETTGWISFGDGVKSVVFRIGLSAVAADQCFGNACSELSGYGGDDFGDTAAVSRKTWNRKLRTVEIEADDDVKKVFYTAMYHALMYPAEFSEGGRYYSAFDDAVHDGVAYTSYSLWDTYRAEHPLLTLIAPERVDGMMTSLLNAYREGGWLPKWPNPAYTGIMVGSPAEIVLAEAYVKGFRGFDRDLAYEAVRKCATVPVPNDGTYNWPDRADWSGHPEVRGGLTTYMSLGYVAADRTMESVSRTQDFGHDDLAAAALAEATGHADEAAYFRARSKNYTNIWHAAKGVFWPRNADGTWKANPSRGRPWPDFTEQTLDTAVWGVPYDVPGLVALHGGKARFVAALDRYFEKHFFGGRADGLSCHENETTHHAAYLYAAVGEYDRCAEKVRRILTTGYSSETWGMEGNDDCGQMSAWYVFSALGFYPLDPVSGEYVIGSPLVRRATLRIGAPYKPAVFTVVVRNQSKENALVRSVKLNGVELSSRRLRHADIVAGGLLEFEMAKDMRFSEKPKSTGKEGIE